MTSNKDSGQADEKKPLHISFLNEVQLNVVVELGRVELKVRDLIKLKQGSVIGLEKLAGEALDVVVNGNIIGRGEGVVVNDKFGLRVTQVISSDGLEDLI
jgi:flagellar motor switch protein FliN/FliY